MATIAAALKNLSTGNLVTRKAWKEGTHLKQVDSTIYRVRPNGTETKARLPSDDLTANDYAKFKLVK
jgi:hypothetical protein